MVCCRAYTELPEELGENSLQIVHTNEMINLPNSFFEIHKGCTVWGLIYDEERITFNETIPSWTFREDWATQKSNYLYWKFALQMQAPESALPESAMASPEKGALMPLQPGSLLEPSFTVRLYTSLECFGQHLTLAYWFHSYPDEGSLEWASPSIHFLPLCLVL